MYAWECDACTHCHGHNHTHGQVHHRPPTPCHSWRIEGLVSETAAARVAPCAKAPPQSPKAWAGSQNSVKKIQFLHTHTQHVYILINIHTIPTHMQTYTHTHKLTFTHTNIFSIIITSINIFFSLLFVWGFCSLRQNHTMHWYVRLASNLNSSCLSLLGAVVTGVDANFLVLVWIL